MLYKYGFYIFWTVQLLYTYVIRTNKVHNFYINDLLQL
jgi:hypothetical protein